MQVVGSFQKAAFARYDLNVYATRSTTLAAQPSSTHAQLRLIVGLVILTLTRNRKITLGGQEVVARV